MATAALESVVQKVKDTIADQPLDPFRLSRDVRLLKTLATDAVEDGLGAAKWAAGTAKRWSESTADAAAVRIRRYPLASKIGRASCRERV